MSVGPLGRADRQQEQVVPDTAAHFRVKLCTLDQIVHNTANDGGN